MIEHTSTDATGGLTIKRSSGYVDVESVRLTDSKIGTTTDADLITLADNAVAITGSLQVSDDFKLSNVSAAITHTAATIGATTGLTISSTAGFVDVESVRFTEESVIGTTNDPDLITLADNAVTVSGTLTVSDDVKLSEATASLTHTALHWRHRDY